MQRTALADRGNANVVRLDVAMDYTVLLQVIQYLEQLLTEAAQQVGR
ncbi:MAG: hypothetical protein U5L03_10035 [Burkholderiaceae bacterium]|nr:hypothetical protein [Burkholderiaceae bacterium]